MAASSDRSHELGSEILAGPDYFYCERARCHLRITVCLRRQEINGSTSMYQQTSFLVCENCDQGMEHKRLAKGVRTVADLEREEVIAGGKNKEEEAKPGNTRLCECGKTTISPSSPLCPSCMAVKSNAKRKAGPSEKGKLKSQAKAKKQGGKKERLAEVSSSTSILVEFCGYEGIFDRITEDALDQVRTVAEQIIWVLKNSGQSEMKGDSHEEAI